MSHKHKEEIIRWANSPEGTKVWVREEDMDEWFTTLHPSWYNGSKYIVDDEYAEVRKALAVGKTTQVLNADGHWYYVPEGETPSWNLPPSSYRVKTEEQEETKCDGKLDEPTKNTKIVKEWMYIGLDREWYTSDNLMTDEEADSYFSTGLSHKPTGREWEIEI
jgi:hypothetical protein